MVYKVLWRNMQPVKPGTPGRTPSLFEKCTGFFFPPNLGKYRVHVYSSHTHIVVNKVHSQIGLNLIVLICSQDEKRYFQLELINRETNFNKVFNMNPNVGVLDPFAYKVELSIISNSWKNKKHAQYSSLSSLIFDRFAFGKIVIE